MKTLLEHNAALIRGLHRAIHDTYERHANGPVGLQAWQVACGEFHTRYDALAFPGGLAAGLERLSAGHMPTAETAIQYLEIRPYFFRSQYHATTFIRRLKKLALRADLQERFDAVLAQNRDRKLRRLGKT